MNPERATRRAVPASRLKWIVVLYATWSIPLAAMALIWFSPDLKRNGLTAGLFLAGATLPPAAFLPWLFPRYPVHFFGLILATALTSVIVPGVTFGFPGLLFSLWLLPLINVFAWPFLLPAWAVAGISFYFATRAGFHVVDGPPKFKCPKCGYSTRGLKDSICPECGADVFLFLEESGGGPPTWSPGS